MLLKQAAPAHSDVIPAKRSAMKNDERLMQTEHQIVDLARQEAGLLDTYEAAVQNPAADGDAPARTLNDVTAKRKAAYSHFQNLMGVKAISQ